MNFSRLKPISGVYLTIKPNFCLVQQFYDLTIDRLSGKICTFAHVTRVFFATSKVTKEAEILQEGFSLIFRRVKLLPDSNISIWLIFCACMLTVTSIRAMVNNRFFIRLFYYDGVRTNIFPLAIAALATAPHLIKLVGGIVHNGRYIRKDTSLKVAPCSRLHAHAGTS